MREAHTIRAEIGTSGQFAEIEFDPEYPHHAVMEAVKAEHIGRGEATNTDDIAVAYHAGFYYAAALLLSGATETPLCDAVIQAIGAEWEGLERADFDAWCKYAELHSTECPMCGSSVYFEGDKPESHYVCGNCAAQWREYRNGDYIALPEECVGDCSGPGAKDEPVEHWRRKLDFHVYAPDAREYLARTGGWSREELADEDEPTLARRILWIAACSLAEDESSIEWYFGE